MEQGTSFQKLLVGFILISLFAVLLINWAVISSNNLSSITGQEQGQNSEYVKSMLQYNNLNSTLSTTQAQAQSWQDDFQSQSIFSIIGGIVVSGIFDLTKLMVSAITLPFSYIGNIMVGVFGFPPLLVSIITALIIIAIIFAIWRLIKIGY